VTRVEQLALHLDRLDPNWVVEIDLDDETPALEQLLLGWLEVDHAETVESLALALAEQAVFSPWGERAWRDVVAQRRREAVEARIIRAWLP
jgi:hypothetical protein